MAHKTLVNGTAYETAAGNVMSGGTVYGIQKGRSLVNGTAYEIPFEQAAPGAECTVSILALAGLSYMHSVEIEGVYYEDTDTVTVPAGTVITCHCMVEYDEMGTGIYLNNEQVVSGVGELVYEYTVNGNVDIEMMSYSGYTFIYIYDV